MATPTHTDTPKPPRRHLAAGIALGAALGALIGVIVAFVMVYALGAVELDEELAAHAFLYFAFEAGFLGAILGGVFAGLSRLRNTR
ncbi:MAG: hypothetical protein ACOC0V_05690 [Oceanicaulis sp.]